MFKTSATPVPGRDKNTLHSTTCYCHLWTFWTCVHVSRHRSCVWSANALSWVPTCNNINFTQGCWLSGSLSAKYSSPLTRPFLPQWIRNIYAARPRQLVKIKKECTNLTEEGGVQTSDQWNTKCNESEILLSSKANTERVHKLDRRRRRLTRDRWKHRELLPLGAYNTCLATLALFSISVCFKIQIQVHEHNHDGEDDQQALMGNYNNCCHWACDVFHICHARIFFCWEVLATCTTSRLYF